MTSAINVFIRDAEYIITFIVSMVFYGTPILYSIDLFPEQYRWILHLNPMATIIESYRDVFFNHVMPNMHLLGIVGLVSVIVFIVGIIVFRKL